MLFISLSCSLWAQQSITRPPVKQIEFFGVDKASRSNVEKWFGLEKNAMIDPETLHQNCTSLLQGYMNDQFAYVTLDSLLYIVSPDSSSAEIRVYIDEGQRIKYGGVEFDGLNTEEQQGVQNTFGLKRNRTFDPDRFERRMDDALTDFERKGYPFIKFDLSSIRIDSSSADPEFMLGFKAAKGPNLIIKEIQIVGNEITKEHVIVRELRIKEGDVYHYEKVSKIPDRLMRTGYFRRVDEPLVFLSEGDQGGLLLTVEEGNTSLFDGVVGYTPGTSDEKGYFTGLINISLGNLFGTGRSLLARWQKRDRFSQDLMFHYREPWMAGWPIHVGVGFNQLIQDSTYIQREYGVDASLPLVESFSVVADLKRTSILPDSMGSYQLGLLKSRTTSASIGITYDSRPDLINPTRGIYYFTSVETGAKTNLGPADLVEEFNVDTKVNNQKYTLDLELFIPTFRRLVLGLTLHGRQIKSSENFIPVPDQFRLGGTRTLRGYREDQFRGTTLGWSNLEYRYILGRRSRAFAFCDLGYYYAENPSGINEGLKIGYGFGVRLETALGIMGIDYGLAYGQKQGLMSGLLHVGLISEF